MSLILDALRKSEAERRRGQAPDLHSPSPLLARIAPRRRSPWPFMLAAIVVVGLVAAAWWWLPPRQPAAPMAAVPAESVTATDTTSEAGVPPTIPVTARVPVVAAPPPPTPEPLRAASPPTEVINPTPAAPRVPTPPVLPSDTNSSVASTNAEPELPTIAALSASQRAAMPAMKMSMHVWAEQPGDRFVIIDGQRVSEGTRLPGASVVEIRQDGVVLDVDGRLYLLPRP